ncbi:MAG: holo-ACP synthase [Puniceicoccales bacterium]|jgi:holo-[acyl-carrier protein] synthase|nr:holo-ACP synthase [Puniceicoccales bacterium]
MNGIKVIGIGVDIVDIGRIRNAHCRWGERFLRRLFCPGELAHCLRRTNPYPSLAARFAAKEAIAKALSVGFGKELSFRSIEIAPAAGAPTVNLAAEARKLLAAMGGSSIMVSLSHSRSHAIAHVLIGR